MHLIGLLALVLGCVLFLGSVCSLVCAVSLPSCSFLLLPGPWLVVSGPLWCLVAGG